MAHLPVSVFTDKAAPTMSERYVHVDTREVISLMEKEGFYVSGAKSAAPKKREALYAKHSIEFRHKEAQVIDGATPRIVFVNSHDGSSAAMAVAGVFRFVCSNGLVVGSTFEKIRQRHAGDAAVELIDRMRALAKNSDRLFAQIEQWQKIDLSKSQRIAFASMAGQLRWGDSQMYQPEEILNVRRAEDDKGDLWSTFNIIQENTVRGGLIGLSRSGRQSTSRPLTDIQRDISYNAQLWQLAEDVAEVW